MEKSKSEIEGLVNTGSSTITYKDCKSSKVFKKIYINGEYSLYVKCVKCTDTYICKYKTGTGCMINHENTVHGTTVSFPKAQLTIDNYSKSCVKADEKEMISRAAAICIATDFLPTSFTEKPGMKQFIEAVTKLCHLKKGKVAASDILSCHRTNMKYVRKIQEEVKEKIKNDLTQVDSVHSTCDHWKEVKTNRDFFTVTIHFVSKEYDIKSSVIATMETSSKTAVQIKKDYKFIIDSFDIGDKIKSIVTDNASSNKSAFQYKLGINWCPCSAHNLNLVLKHSFDICSKDIDYGYVSDVDTLISSTKELAKYCKKSGINSKLDISAKQSVDVRWDSTLELLESINISFEQLQSLAQDNSALFGKLALVNKQLMEQIIGLLSPFRTARQKLCRNSDPTYHEVAVIKQYLLCDHLIETQSDTVILKHMKSRLRKNMDKFPVTVDHLIASFLTPGLKLNFLNKYYDQGLVDRSKEHLRSLCKELNLDTSVMLEPPSKKPKRDDILASYYTASSIPTENSLTEIQRYQTKVVSDIESEESPLVFWSKHEKLFPKLYRIAMDLIPIPATSVKSEQNFSAAGRLISNRRTKLTSDNIDALLFIHSNTSYLEPF